MKIAAIDQGTTSTRLLIASEKEPPHIAHSIQHNQFYPNSGWVEHDPEELIANILSCIDVAGPLNAIGLDNQGESCLAWDKITKQALTPVIVWQDNRTNAKINQLKSDGLEVETLTRAGLPLDSYFSASKLSWIVQNVPAAKTALKHGNLCLGTTDAFFLDRLTGKFVTDVTTASRTSLMNIKTREWDLGLCELFGVPIQTLPEIVPVTGELGAIKTDHGNIPITASIVDQQASLYGFGCRNIGQTKFTFGTGAFALRLTGEQIIQEAHMGLLPTIAWQKYGEPPVYALEGGVYTASAAIDWAKSLGLFPQYSQINHFEGPSAIEKGLIFVPALTGLACPHWDRAARGMWSGLSLDNDGLQLTRSILEGIAFRAAEVIEAMNNCLPASGPLLIDGGMSNNPYFVQFLTDILQTQVRKTKMSELTAIGTAKLAAECIGMRMMEETEFATFKSKANRQALLNSFKKVTELVKAQAQNQPTAIAPI